MKSPETNPAAPVDDLTPEPVPKDPDNGAFGQLPIAVSDGDFSTPIKRTRTITRPRGLKTLEQEAAATNFVDASPPPQVAVAPEPELVPDTPPPVLDPIPPEGHVARHEASVVDEFLAAPPTPEPEIQETPGPDLSESSYALELPSDDAALSRIENADALSDPRESALSNDRAESLAYVFAPGSGVADQPDAVDLPDVVDLSDVTAGDSIASRQSDIDARMVNDLLDQATAQILASSPDEVAITDDALSSAMGEVTVLSEDHPREAAGESAQPPSAPTTEPGLSPLAQTLAHMAEAMQGDLAIEETVELDIADAPLLPLPPEALTPVSPPPHTPPPRAAPPPPPLPVPTVAASPDVRLPIATLAGLPEALVERPRRPKRSKPWYEEVFDESYLRTLPFMTAEQTLHEVDFIESSLGVPRGSEVLDVACGYGRHAIELVQRGLAVTGLDLSLPLLIRAADESQRRGVSVNFVHTDMREMSFERQFSGAYCMLTSFGYFDEDSNLKVVEGIARALKPGGRFLIDVINRDYVVGDLPARVWWEGEGCVVLEEVDFNFNTNRILTHRSVVFEDGQQLEQEISIRVYSLHEMGKLLRQAGFRVIEVSGSIPTRGHFFGANSRNLLILAERRSE